MQYHRTQYLRRQYLREKERSLETIEDEIVKKQPNLWAIIREGKRIILPIVARRTRPIAARRTSLSTARQIICDETDEIYKICSNAVEAINSKTDEVISSSSPQVIKLLQTTRLRQRYNKEIFLSANVNMNWLRLSHICI